MSLGIGKRSWLIGWIEGSGQDPRKGCSLISQTTKGAHKLTATLPKIVSAMAAMVLFTTQISANELQGKVIRVADGDTITILIEPIKLDMPIRLSGIDAPEKKGMAFGEASKKSLSDLAFGKTAVVEWGKKDKYGRIVGKVRIDGQDINLVQVQRGMAWHFKEYEREQPAEDRVTYAEAENVARAGRIGLWQDKDPVPPWTWRKAQRADGKEVVVEEAVK